MRKKLIIAVIIILFLCIAISGCIDSEDTPSYHGWQQEELPWSLYIYNGTRFFVDEFAPIKIDEDNGIFTINMNINFDDYNDTLIIESQDIIYYYQVENPGQKKGQYKIDDLHLMPIGNSSDYPHDVYNCDITFRRTGSEGYFVLKDIKGHINQSGWRLDIYGEGDKLYFTFTRIQEVYTFNLLLLLGYISIIISVISLLLWLIIWKEGTIFGIPIMDFGNFLFYLGNVIGIPFYFGVIMSFIIYDSPTLRGSYIDHLWLIFFSSVILSSFVFTARNKSKVQRYKDSKSSENIPNDDGMELGILDKLPSSLFFVVTGFFSMGFGAIALIQGNQSVGYFACSFGIGLISVGLGVHSIRISKTSERIAKESDRKMSAIANVTFLQIMGVFEDARMIIQYKPINRRIAIWKCLTYLKQVIEIQEFAKPGYRKMVANYLKILMKRYPWDNDDVRIEEISHFLTMYSYVLAMDINEGLKNTAIKLLESKLGVSKAEDEKNDEFLSTITRKISRYKNETKFNDIKEELKEDEE